MVVRAKGVILLGSSLSKTPSNKNNKTNIYILKYKQNTPAMPLILRYCFFSYIYSYE